METAVALAAVYGAILSSLIFGWTIYRDVRDRGKLRVVCGFRMIISPGLSTEENVLVFQITNTGTRQVMVTNAGGMFMNGKGFVVNAPNLPKMLAPAEYFSVHMKEYDFSDELKSLQVYTSLDQVYEASSKDLLSIKKELQRLHSKGITRSTTV
jgi:hypothetical protein